MSGLGFRVSRPSKLPEAKALYNAKVKEAENEAVQIQQQIDRIRRVMQESQVRLKQESSSLGMEVQQLAQELDARQKDADRKIESLTASVKQKEAKIQSIKAQFERLYKEASDQAFSDVRLRVSEFEFDIRKGEGAVTSVERALNQVKTVIS